MSFSSFLTPFIALMALALSAHADQVPGLVLPFKEVSVSSPVLQDVVKDIEVDEGDQVKQGQVLAHLLNDREQIDVQRTQNLIKRAEFEYKGMKALADEKIDSQDS